jgi:hypothetical protein
MLAYVFWHRPRPDVEAVEYEGAQRDFHAALEIPSACFRMAELPFGEAAGGYEDWYLVDDWAALGKLNAEAIDSIRLGQHNRAASGVRQGWGGVYELVRGAAAIPVGTKWLDKPRGEPSGAFVASLHHGGVWRRQLVLGPAPEFCCSVAAADARTPL